MKNLVLAFCLFIITSAATAAEITFLDNPVWSTVLEKAKKEKKMIFLDGYATWCGPCKTMDAETYKDQAVADYYNANFINVKYDMEKGEGPMLAERYLVTAFPNLIFIDTEGVMLHRGIGFMDADEFVGLGRTAQDPESQYYTLKKQALSLNPTQFAKFASIASTFNDEDFDDLSRDYLAKQSDVLGNIDLINLIMNDINSLNDEKTLAYIVANKAKIVNTQKYTAAEVDQRLISLTLGYGIYQSSQKDETSIDFDGIKGLLDKYVPEKAFFVYHFFRIQYFLEEKKTEDAIEEFDLIIDNTPAKVDFDQLCNALMSFGPILAQEGKLAPVMAKFDALVVPAKDAELGYMKDFVKGIIHIKLKEYDQFKAVAAALIKNPKTPENVKADLKQAMDQIEEQLKQGQ